MPDMFSIEDLREKFGINRLSLNFVTNVYWHHYELRIYDRLLLMKLINGVLRTVEQ